MCIHVIKRQHKKYTVQVLHSILLKQVLGQD